MKLFACMCNQPQRLAAALAPVRAALVAAPPVSRWGLGYVQGGDVLLVRTPRASEQPVDLAAPLAAPTAELKSDCAIAQAVRDPAGAAAGSVRAGTDSTPPFRFRRWLYAQTGAPSLDAAAPRLLEALPEYLRRNIKGRTAGELMFHVFLANMAELGSLEDPNLPVAAQRRALARALQQLAAAAAAAGQAGPQAPAVGDIAVTNGRSMVLANLTGNLRVRRLTVTTDRGERDESFRGFVLLSSDDGAGDARDGFEVVPARQAVLITRDLQLSFADLAP